jgi:hypothetical protein
MFIAKQKEGFCVLDNKNRKVELYYKGKIVTHLPSIADIGLSYWHKNYKDIIVEDFEALPINASSFKSLRWSIMEYYANKENKENKGKL